MEENKAVSPTGTPLISQTMLRWILVAYASLGALEGALATALGTGSTVVKALAVVLAVLTPALAALSPGLRTQP